MLENCSRLIDNAFRAENLTLREFESFDQSSRSFRGGQIFNRENADALWNKVTTFNETSSLPDTACAILAGGRSSRFGANKAFAHLHGVRLIDLVKSRLMNQTVGPIVINTRKYDEIDAGPQPHAPDRIGGDIGPLAGIHAALCWANDRGFEAIITTPVDTPILPDCFINRLSACQAPSVSKYGDAVHFVHGIWSVKQISFLETCISEGMRSVRNWHLACNANQCEFPDGMVIDPFTNINTEEDLANVEDLIAPRFWTNAD